jgi:hypothetical protein
MSGPNLAVADGGGRREHAEGGTQQTESRA